MDNPGVFIIFLVAICWFRNSGLVVEALSKPLPQSLNKVEASAVKRFKNYDQLCKTCPTLLQPRIETLEEMIMGLETSERNTLLAHVARRMERNQANETTASSLASDAGIQTAKDVFEFQTGQKVPATDDFVKERAQRKKNTLMMEEKTKTVLTNVSPDKTLAKMEKTRKKFETNRMKMLRLKCLLDQTSRLLSRDAQALDQFCDTSDSSLYHTIDELQAMSRPELKMQRLKYIAQLSQYQQKIAKGRAKLYEASLKLGTTRKV